MCGLLLLLLAADSSSYALPMICEVSPEWAVSPRPAERVENWLSVATNSTEVSAVALSGKFSTLSDSEWWSIHLMKCWKWLKVILFLIHEHMGSWTTCLTTCFATDERLGTNALRERMPYLQMLCTSTSTSKHMYAQTKYAQAHVCICIHKLFDVPTIAPLG